MKLTKENIYIDLKGKNKEDLTDLYNFLESVGEKQFSSLKEFINESVCCDYFLWGSFKQWISLSTKKGNRKEVTIQQLKEILQPMENKGEQFEKAEEILTLENVKVDCRGLTGKEIIKISDIIYNKKGTRPVLTANGYIVHGHQSMRTIISYEKFMELFGNKEETLQQKEQRLLKELEEVRKEIEDSKVKVGDWVVVKETKEIFKVDEDDIEYLYSHHEKITNPQLIELLEQEMN